MKVVPKLRGQQTREKVLRKLAGEADYLMRVQECLGVVQLYETFEDAEKVFFVCELCSGGDLEQIVEVGLSMLRVGPFCHSCCIDAKFTWQTLSVMSRLARVVPANGLQSAHAFWWRQPPVHSLGLLSAAPSLMNTWQPAVLQQSVSKHANLRIARAPPSCHLEV